MKRELKLKAIELRKKGYSIKELHEKLGVSKSSVSLWVNKVVLSKKAQKRINERFTKGQLASQETIKEQTRQKNIVAKDFTLNILKNTNLNKETKIILCSMIYQCEGAKSIKNGINFTNSDPDLIVTFISLFRTAFDLDESKFRVLMHLHNYHDEKKSKRVLV